MPTQQGLEAFIAQVVSGDHAGAIRDWYAETASMQENQSPPRVGRDLLVRQETRTLERMKHVVTELLDPPLVDGERVALHWRFSFTPLAGAPFSIEEIAWQRWEGDRIVEETFYYDPAQFGKPSEPAA